MNPLFDTDLYRKVCKVIQGHGKAKGVCSWMPRINQPEADKPGDDREVLSK
jgi:hypothetical protein